MLVSTVKKCFNALDDSGILTVGRIVHSARRLCFLRESDIGNGGIERYRIGHYS